MNKDSSQWYCGAKINISEESLDFGIDKETLSLFVRRTYLNEEDKIRHGNFIEIPYDRIPELEQLIDDLKSIRVT